MAYSPFAFPASLRILATLAILKSLAFFDSWLMKAESPMSLSIGEDDNKSMIDDSTTEKSKTFQLL